MRVFNNKQAVRGLLATLVTTLALTLGAAPANAGVAVKYGYGGYGFAPKVGFHGGHGYYRGGYGYNRFGRGYYGRGFRKGYYGRGFRNGYYGRGRGFGRPYYRGYRY